MFIDFFYLLRKAGIEVSPTEWLTFVAALEKNLHDDSLIGFYHLARMTLVKSESNYDDFDRAFLAYFKGTELPRSLKDAIQDWLAKPIPKRELTDAERAALKALDSDELRKLFEQRLKEQKERHDGGNRWIGTGGTSPFGHGGENPAGIRVGGDGGSHTAIQVATERRFANYRDDLTLDTRQIGVALRKLRVLARHGQHDEIDIDESIDQTCRDGGEIHVAFRPPRKNNMKVMLLMDVGGTMDPYTFLVSQLFSAAHAANHFKQFRHFYFHNCVYEQLYPNASFWRGTPTSEILRDVDRDTRVIFVGDAYMYIGELTEPFGAGYYYHKNTTTGLDWLKRLRDRFEFAVWLNPRPQSMWGGPSISLIRTIFPMMPLTLAGLDSAIRVLTGADKASRTMPQTPVVDPRYS